MKKIAIIGAGFGGLAAAIRLQARGFNVTLLEKNAQVGGQASQFKKKGYTFDMGPSLVTAPDIIRAVFASAGRSMDDYVDLVPLEPYYRMYFHDGSVLDYSGDAATMEAQMRQYNTADAENYNVFMCHVKQLYNAVIEDGLGSEPFTWKTLLKFLPRAVFLSALKPAFSVVKKYFTDFRHRFAFSFHPLFIGGSPFSAPAVYLMIPYLEKVGGVSFPKGGMYSLVQALERLLLEIGGTIRTDSEVSRIVTHKGKVTGIEVAGAFEPYDLVISNAHFAHTHLDLLTERSSGRWTRQNVERLSYSMSCFLIYIGVRKQYPKLLHHTLILSERYKELVKDIFDRKILPDDFSMYLHAPTRTDSSMAPPGCESLYVLIPVPNLDAGIDWEERAASFRDKILAFLEEDFGLEGLRDNLDVLEVFTPRDFEIQRNNYLGSAWGVEPKLTQTASFRPGNRSEDLENLYLVGASTHPGAGVPGVLLTAEATEKAIMEDFKLDAAAAVGIQNVHEEVRDESVV